MTPVRAALLVGAAVAVATCAGIPAGASYGAQTTADEPQYLLSALSLWEDADLDIADELSAERYRPFHAPDLPEQTELLAGGRRLSPHDPLLPLLLAVPMGIGGWVGAKVALALLAGALAGLLTWTATRRLGVPLGVAIAVVGVFCASPPLAVYATQVYPELPAALAVAVAVACLLGPMRRRGSVGLVLAVVALPWLAVKFVPVAGVLALAGLVRVGGRTRAVVAACLAGAALVYVGAHLAIYDGFTAYAAGDHFTGGEFSAVGAGPDLWGRAGRLAGLLVDREFGLAPWQPAYLLAPVALAALISERRRGWPVIGATLATGWLVATFVALTMHGWWFPGRQVVVILPAVVWAIAWWTGRARQRVLLTVALGAAGVVAYVSLVIEALAGRLTIVVDFMTTINPLYRVTRVLLPAYRTPTAGTWVLHALWVAVFAGLVVAGWRTVGAKATPGVSRDGGEAVAPLGAT